MLDFPVVSAKAQPAGVKPFLERIQEGVVVCDGAMGTVLYSRGVFQTRCFDELNLSNPKLVQSVHREYLAVGSDMIETNTYGANRFKLQPHGFGDVVREVNRQGAAIARECAESVSRPVLVAGSVGPLGKPIAPSQTRGERLRRSRSSPRFTPAPARGSRNRSGRGCSCLR